LLNVTFGHAYFSIQIFTYNLTYKVLYLPSIALIDQDPHTAYLLPINATALQRNPDWQNFNILLRI